MSQPNPQPSKTLPEQILRLFEARGHSRYGGEAVSQQEHALQAAMFAERDSAPPALIVAALLHDVGHLLHQLPADAPEQGIDDRHETLAARWLARHFEADVVEPVRLHVAAKRYLCAVDADYHRALSPPSIKSLQLQGGPMTPPEAREFESQPHFDAAVRLRRWDDDAKIVGLATPDVRHFLKYVE